MTEKFIDDSEAGKEIANPIFYKEIEKLVGKDYVKTTKALCGYITSRGISSRISAASRGEKRMGWDDIAEYIIEYAYFLKKLINENKQDEGVLYRGTSIFEEEINELKPGYILKKQVGILSFTQNENVAKRFSGSEAYPAIIITNQKGLAIGKYSNRPAEEEVLLDITSATIKSIEVIDGIRYIQI